MDSSFVRKYFFFALLAIAIAFGVVLFWPFLIIIALSIVVSVLLHPLYAQLHKIVRSPSFASFLTILCFIIIICIPLFFFATVVVRQSQSMYQWLVAHDAINTSIQTLNAWIHHIFPNISLDIQAQATSLASQIASRLGSVITAALSTIVSFLFMLLTIFYFLKDGPAWKDSLIEFVPLSNDSNREIISTLRKSINGIVRGYIVVGIAQGTVTGVGLFLFHVPHAVLWGALAVIASIIPPFGTALITVPSIIYLFLDHRTGGAIGFALWAIFLSGTVDNILNPFVVGKQIHIHPLLVLFSVLGGIALLGPVGILIGPLVISFIYALISVYKTEMNK